MRSARPGRVPNPPDIEPRDQLRAADKLPHLDTRALERVLLSKVTSPALTISHLELREVILHDVDIANSNIRFGKLSDVIVELSNLTNSEWKSLCASRVIFDRSKMLGMKVNDAELFDLRVVECQMQYAQLRFSKLAGSWFERCDLRGADFSGSDLTGATFENCELTGAFFSEAKCFGVDFRSSTVDGLTMGPDSLVGAIINPFQAASIVKVFGLTVLHQDEELPDKI